MNTISTMLQTNNNINGTHSVKIDRTDFLAASAPFNQRLMAAGCRPTSTLLGVTRLAAPELLVEIEATAIAA